MGYWWLGAKTYLRDRAPPKWLNKSECVAPESIERYDEKYSGADRALSGLMTRPVFVLEERERAPLAVRSLAATSLSERLEPCFLVSREFRTIIESIDPRALVSADCDVRCHCREGVSGYVLADAALCVDALTVLDRANSSITIQVGFAHDDGRRTHAVDIAGPVRFALDAVSDRALFRVQLGWMDSRLAVSGALAEAIFESRFLGLCLNDATGRRIAPERFREYSTEGWEELYPA